MFVFSYYSEDSEFFDATNKNVIGKMKDELRGRIISEFVGLKPKMYSLIGVDSKEVKKAKRFSKNVVRNIRHEECINVFFNKKMTTHKMKRIQSKLHRIGTYDSVKFICFVLMINDTY